LELAIGVIINCEQREIYINAILYLQEQYQTQLMHLIKKIIDKTKMKEGTEVRDIEKEKKLLIKLDEVENENAILITRLQESNEEKEKFQNKVGELQQQCILFEEQIRNLNLKQEQFLSRVKNVYFSNENHLNKRLESKILRIMRWWLRSVKKKSGIWSFLSRTLN